MNENNQIIIYQTEDGQTRVDVRMENDTVWLTQAQMAELFQKDRTVITRHINNVFKEGELNREEVCAKIAHTVWDQSRTSPNYCTEYNSLSLTNVVNIHPDAL